MNPTRTSSVAVAAMILAAALTSPLALAQTRPATSPAPAPVRPNAQAAPSTPDEVFAAWDKDHNKTLSIDEFKAGWEDVREATTMRRLQLQFQAMDTNKNGTIEPIEYANLPAVKNSGASAPPMSNFDTNKNQSLDFPEFLGFVEAMIKSMRPAARK
jgi:Ca2+-binding EF-hand superfamily protein